MEPPLYVRSLTAEEHKHLQAALRSSDAFTLRRAQIALASARGQSAKPIAHSVGCAVQTVRNSIRAFNSEGLLCLQKQSNRPKNVPVTLDAGKRERLKA